MQSLKDKINNTRSSIIAIGFKPNANQVTILGSGFCVGKQGEILSAFHLSAKLTDEQKAGLLGMAMVKHDQKLETYSWFPLEIVVTNERNDLAVLRMKDYEKTLLKPLELDDSEKVEVGDEAYFIGFPYAAQLINDGFGITLIANRTMISNIKRDGVDQDHPRNWLIVDAISNPGNSGCPVISTETNKVIGVMTIAFRTKSKTLQELDIREPMHIAGARPINLAKSLLK
ncbi:MAG: serine protease [Candidatus Paceibacterota bacterium]|jgi:serine protease Do